MNDIGKILVGAAIALASSFIVSICAYFANLKRKRINYIQKRTTEFMNFCDLLKAEVNDSESQLDPGAYFKRIYLKWNGTIMTSEALTGISVKDGYDWVYVVDEVIALKRWKRERVKKQINEMADIFIMIDIELGNAKQNNQNTINIISACEGHVSRLNLCLSNVKELKIKNTTLADLKENLIY